ncbi:hypothetical protein C8R47DRAFT_1029309, partial [Mycena vitilis]
MDQTPPNTPQRARIASQRQERESRVLDSPQHHRLPRIANGPQPLPRAQPQPPPPLQQAPADIFGGGPIALQQQITAGQRLTPNTRAALQERIAQLVPLQFNPAPYNPNPAAPRRHNVNAVPGPSNAPLGQPQHVPGPANAPYMPILQQPREVLERRIAELNVRREFQPIEPERRRGRRAAAVQPPIQPNNPAPPVAAQIALPPPHIAQQNNQGHQPNNAPQPEFPNFVAAANLPHYAKPVIEAHVKRITLGRMNLVCPECGALHWEAERLSKSSLRNPQFGTCCLNGKVDLPAVRAPPRDLLELFDGTSVYSPDFKKNIRSYNAAFALASLGVKVDRSVLDGGGPYVFKIQGALYHHVGALLPQPGATPAYAQLYFYSTDEANRARLRRNQGNNNTSGLNNAVMGILDHVLRENNAYVQVFKTAHERMRAQEALHPNVPSEIYAVIRCEAGTDPRRYNAPTVDEVAVILPGDGSRETVHRDLIVHYRNGAYPLKRIYETSASYQPMVYVLLFPHGENGWHSKIPLNLIDEEEEDEEEDE